MHTPQIINIKTIKKDVNFILIKRLNEVVEKHNLPRMTLHGLRHTRATLLDQQGTRGKLISDILGHTNSRITNRYTHLYLEEQREIMKKLNS